ncbi:ABC transporter ATP-binding protein [Fuscibacter oryzae]|uniref:ABC transporter ATP-binding protein n=1 Tax=Fuscibacter oryzae TaxID=2803939 RepID=A0A8J7SX25_9RHOB|nr:ABC transporter ATP-binding protein [Fuscibacter oryzae]MBL4929529.1 ABC transporter ATP-binding protein [Fuscibacter oryzae]
MTTADSIISIANVGKKFGTYQALHGIDLEVRKGEIVTLLGPSGCGKTTLMRLIAGFEDVTSGNLRIGGKDMVGVPPEKRPINMVFQRYALFPHLDVYENVAYGLRVRRLPAAEIESKVRRMLDIVQLSQLSQRYINELSGGQCQRVALARALVNEPQVLLMDEPLAALDLKIRQTMLEEMKRIHAATGTTFIYVTHDQDEAMILSDRIVLLNKGEVVQIDEPHQMYAEPKSLFAAKFLGETNLFPVRMVAMADGSSGSVHATGAVFTGKQPQPLKEGDSALASIRPEALYFAASERHRQSFKARITDELFIGSRSFLTAQLTNGDRFRIQIQRGTACPPVSPEAQVDVFWSPEDVSIYPAALT